MEGGTKPGTIRGGESGLGVTNTTGRRRSRGQIENANTTGTPGGFAEDTTQNFLQTLALPTTNAPTGGMGTVGQSASGNLDTSFHMSHTQRRRSSAAASMAAGVLNNFLKKPDDQPEDPYRLTICDQIRLTFSSLNATSNFEKGVTRTRTSCLWFVNKVLQSSYWDLVMLLLTVWMLAGDTFRVTYVRKENDWKVEGFSICALAVCFLDICFRLIAESNYNCSFLFMMDMFSLYSIVWDIGVLIYQKDKEVWYTDKDEGYYVAGETARIVCLLRLARLARLVHVNCGKGVRPPAGKKATVVPTSKSEDEGKGGKGGRGGGEGGPGGPNGQPAEGTMTDKERSKVGNEFIEMTVRKVIVVIVVVCLFVPVLEPSRLLYPRSVFQYQQQGLDQLHQFTNSIYGNHSHTVTAQEQLLVKKSLIDYVVTIPTYPEVDMAQTNVLYIQLENIPFGTTTAWLREANYTLISIADINRDYRPIEAPAYQVGETIAYFRAKYWVRYNARLNLMLRFFALLLAFAMGLAFTSIQNTVIAPIERMTKLVESLGENPLAKLEKNKPNRAAQTMKRKGTRRSSVAGPDDTPETELLENALLKITELLQIGFGAAGAEIIAKNMKAGGGDIKDVLTRGGKTVTCIFAFIKMDDFSTLCSCLEEDVCTYINTIARLVHVDVVNNHGAPNKNIGQAFFCVWKREESDMPDMGSPMGRSKTPGVTPTSNPGLTFHPGGAPDMLERGGPTSLQSLAEYALCAITKIRLDMYRCNRDATFEKFRANPNLIDKFDDDFQCVMHYGLHIGEAIEGALGSANKIDATYLSPNVNLASRLEAACHQFSVDFLMSGVLVNLFSDGIRKLCRQVDCVTVKGSKIPMDIWTFDISDYPPVPNQTWDDKIGQKFAVSTLLPAEVDLSPLEGEGFLTKLKWLQASLPDQFRFDFDFGLRAYLDGEWRRAKDFLASALNQYEDGPTRLLLSVVEGGVAPENWSGCRKLENK